MSQYIIVDVNKKLYVYDYLLLIRATYCDPYLSEKVSQLMITHIKKCFI